LSHKSLTAASKYNPDVPFGPLEGGVGREADERLRKHGQTKASEVVIEREAGSMIEQRGNYDKRDRITKAESMITSVRAKNLFGFAPHTVAIDDDVKPGFHVGQKGEGSLKVVPVPEQRHGFADDIPGGAKRRAYRGRFRDKRSSSCMVGVFRIEAGIEE
jgi:hypothetical protein